MTPKEPFPFQEPEADAEKSGRNIGAWLSGFTSKLDLKSWMILAMLGGFAMDKGAVLLNKDEAQVLMDEEDWRRVVREELKPLESGFRALILTLPANQQNKVLQAMIKTRDRQRDGD